jgi:hypothetical protein
MDLIAGVIFVSAIVIQLSEIKQWRMAFLAFWLKTILLSKIGLKLTQSLRQPARKLEAH